MKAIIGIVLIVCGIILGLYMGVWVCFIGGICDVISQIRAEEMEAMGVAWGIAKVLFSGAVGWISALVMIVPGASFINN